jgi:hypothetical protein
MLSLFHIISTTTQQMAKPDEQQQQQAADAAAAAAAADDEAFIGDEGGLPEGVEVLDDLEGVLKNNAPI